MRLTEKDIKENHYFVKPINKDVAIDFESRIKADDKLGQLEDIEDELGIDLITLCNISKIFIVNWFHGIEKKVLIEKIDFVSFNKKALVSIYEDELGQEKYIYYYFKDYGKTWALTKEELA